MIHYFSVDSPDLQILESALSQREHNPVAVFDEGRDYNPISL